MLQEVITAEGVGEGRAIRHSRCACVERGMHLETFIAPGSIVKGSWPGGVSVLFPSSWPYQHSACRGSKVSVLKGHMATGCCGLEGKTGFSLLQSHRAGESIWAPCSLGPSREQEGASWGRERTKPKALQKRMPWLGRSTAARWVTLVHLCGFHICKMKVIMHIL